MDPLTHSLVGGLAAKTVKASPRRFWFMILLGILPDIDVLFNGLGSWAFWLYHRGITHSLVGWVVQSLFWALVLSRWDRGSFRLRALHYSIPIGLHILGDYLTSYGIPILAPFTLKHFSGDLVGSLALLPILFMGAGLVYLQVREKHGWQETRFLWVAWGIYLMFNLSGKTYADKLSSHYDGSSMTIPSVFSPFHWTSIHHDKKAQSYETYSINLLSGKTERFHSIPSSFEEFPVQASLASESVQTFLKENRWPVVRVLPHEGGWDVDWGTLMFSTRGLVRGKLSIDVSSNGQILGEHQTIQFWSPKEPAGA